MGQRGIMLIHGRIECLKVRPRYWAMCCHILPLVESTNAVQHVLKCLGYDGSDSKSGSFLLEMHPDELQWIKVSSIFLYSPA